tara:strand:- start:413 stop:949 length:537 start_codon:yes stop_codon:yes gene_type:complete
MKSFVLLIYISYLVYVQSLTEIVIILGCSNNLIQNQRVEAGMEYVKQSKLDKILYLSGGIKNQIKNDVSESSKMLKQIMNENLNAKIILDETSKNTAENFVNLKRWVQNNHLYNLFNFVIVTSDFHKERALSLFNGIFGNVNPQIVLSESNCIQCWNDERIHSKNIHTDIIDALIYMD